MKQNSGTILIFQDYLNHLSHYLSLPLGEYINYSCIALMSYCESLSNSETHTILVIDRLLLDRYHSPRRCIRMKRANCARPENVCVPTHWLTNLNKRPPASETEGHDVRLERCGWCSFAGSRLVFRVGVADTVWSGWSAVLYNIWMYAAVHPRGVK